MLRVYIDDSGRGNAPVFVLSGLLSRAVDWAKFIDEWDETLKAEPLENYRKMQEFMRMDIWSDPRSVRKLEKLYALQRVINKHVQYGIEVCIPCVDYRSVFRDAYPKMWRSEYHFAVRAMIVEVLNVEYAMVRKEKVDFIFDEQVNESAAVQISWKQLKDSKFPSKYRRRMGSLTYASDDDVRPLQAADMMAWLSRRLVADMLGDAGNVFGSPEAGRPLYNPDILNQGLPSSIAQQAQDGDLTPAETGALALRLSSKAYYAGKGISIPIQRRYIDANGLVKHRDTLIQAGEMTIKPDSPKLTRRERKKLTEN